MRHPEPITAEAMRWLALLATTALISVAFFRMVEPYLESLLLAAMLAGVSAPLYCRLLRLLGGHRGRAALLTMLVLGVVVVGPVLIVVVAATADAIWVAGEIRALVQRIEAGNYDFAAVPDLPDWLPFRADIAEAWPKVLAKVGQLAEAAARFLVSSLSSVTIGAAMFFLQLFVFAFALFFFLQMDPPVLKTILSYSGLSPATQERIFDRVASVSRATLRGSLLVGVIQGSLGFLGILVAGVDGAIFWAVVMVIAAMVPGFGAPGVIAGGAIWLMLQKEWIWGIALFVYAVGFVATIDNVIRPRLVGRDAKIHDVFILISTLGGLSLFGAPGLVVGPVLAGVFITVWTVVAERMREMTEPDAGGRDPARDDGPADGEG